MTEILSKADDAVERILSTVGQDVVIGLPIGLAKRKEMIAKKAEQGRAKTLEQLIELGRSRGYKHPVGWARKIMASRHF